jgi:outer membrane protein OmpA-like peptidoglycan-associated protein
MTTSIAARTFRPVAILGLLLLVACAAAPKPRELEAFEGIRAQQSMYEAARKRAPQLVTEAEQLLAESQKQWQDKDLEDSRRSALMGQTKLKTAYALVEQDMAKARIDKANREFGKTEEEWARNAKDLALISEQVTLLRKLGEQKQMAAAEKEKMAKQLSEEQRRIAEERDRGQAQQKIAAAELALKSAEAVNAANYAAVEYGAAKDMLERARAEIKQSNWSGASLSAELAKSKADQATTTARPQFDSAEAGRDAKARNEELSREAASLPGTTVKLERKGEVSRLVMPYKGLFTKKMTTITPGSDAALDAVAALLKKHAGYPVQVIGHTDNRGKKDALLALSQARAQSVYNALVTRGVDAKRMSASGMGPDEPVSDNKSAGGRAANNRVEVVLILQ